MTGIGPALPSLPPAAAEAGDNRAGRPAASRTEPLTAGPPSASCPARLMAMLIDLAILAGLHITLLVIYGSLLWQTLAFDLQRLLGASLLGLCFFLLNPPLLALVYFTVFHSRGGQTPGKMLMGIRVTALAGGPVSPGAAFLRCAGYLLSAAPLGAGFFWAVIDKDHRAWHDKLAATRVIAVEIS